MKNKLQLIVITISTLILSQNIYAQLPGFNWAKTFGGIEKESIKDIEIDANNNIYFCGTFKSPTLNIGSNNLTGNGSSDYGFLAKMAPNGTILWALNMGSDTYAHSIAMDTADNVLIVLTKFNDLIIKKFDQNGVQTFTDTNVGLGILGIAGRKDFDIVVDQMNFYYVNVRYSSSTSLTVDGITLTPNTNSSIRIVKFNPSGVAIMAYNQSAQAMLYQYPSIKLLLDNNGNLILGGYVTYSTGSMLLTSKFNTIGNQVWLYSFPVYNSAGVAGEVTYDSQFDSSGNIIVGGTWNSTSYPTINFGSSAISGNGGIDGVILKYDFNGNPISGKSYLDTPIKSLVVDNSNNIYFTCNNVVGANTSSITKKVNPAYTELWSKTIDNNGNERGEVLAIDHLNNLISSGTYTSGNVNIETEILVNSGVEDIYMVKYCTGTTASISTLPKACINVSSITLTGGNPSGGIYSGTGISGGVFSPSIVGLGTYPVTYTYTDPNGCKNFDIDSITVYPQPIVSFASLPDRCVNASNFTLSGGFPSGGTYSGTAVTSNIFSPSTAGVGSFPITYSYTNSNGCFNSATQNQTVNALPSITFTPLPSICQGTATFNLNGALPSGGTYSGNGVVSNVFYPSATGVGVGTHNITYTFQDPNGCVNSSSQPLTVTPLPSATFIVNHETYVGACDGSIVANISNGTGFINTIWTNSSSTVIGFTNSLSSLCPGIYTLTLTDSIVCSKTYNITINAGPLPPAVPICLVTVDDFSNHNLIVWEKPVSTQIDSFRIYRETTTNVFSHIGSVHYDSLSLFHDYNANPNVTSYRYKIASVDPLGNLSPFSAAHRTIHLIVNNGGSQQNLQWNDYEGAPIQYYQVWRDDLGTNIWNPLSSTIPAGVGTVTWSDLNPSPNPNARYYLDVIWTNTCDPTRTTINTTRSNIKGNAFVGISESELNNSISVFPNPSSKEVTIQMTYLKKGGTISIKNQIGETILNLYTTNLTETLNIENLSNGIYFITIQTEYGIVHKKIIKQ